MLSGAQEQVTNFVRDRAAEQCGDRCGRASGNAANGEHVNGHQNSAALLSIEHRLSKRNNPVYFRGAAIDESQH
jgi:hypothetical protein